MGLDMYLYRKTCVKNWDHMEEDQKHIVTVTKAGEPLRDIDPNKVAYIVEEVAYWRKANHIHQWFVSNIQGDVDDCGTYYVDGEKITELLDTCRQVLRAGDEETARDLLPTTNGFFFGGTEYDEWYFKDVQNTLDMLEPLLITEQSVLGEPEKRYFNSDFEYSSSW